MVPTLAEGAAWYNVKTVRGNRGISAVNIFPRAGGGHHKRVRRRSCDLQPPRYRNEVNSSYLPACGFPAPGGPAEIAP